MTLAESVAEISGFSSWNHADKIKYFAWFLHAERGQDYFTGTDVKKCFDELHLAGPASVGPFLAAMEKRTPKEALKGTKGYKLEKRVRETFEQKYGEREATVVVHKMLTELPAKVPGIEEREFLNETLKCFKHKAFRAAIVMAWNLAYDHFEHWILSDPDRLKKFNTQLPVSYPKADMSAIAGIDDFSHLKEDQVLTVAKKAGLLNVNLHKVMKEKLDRRNIVAHPSSIVVAQVTAEDCIKDLVENVVLKLA